MSEWADEKPTKEVKMVTTTVTKDSGIVYKLIVAFLGGAATAVAAWFGIDWFRNQA